MQAQGGFIDDTFANAITNVGLHGVLGYAPDQVTFTVTNIDSLFHDGYEVP